MDVDVVNLVGFALYNWQSDRPPAVLTDSEICVQFTNRQAIRFTHFFPKMTNSNNVTEVTYKVERKQYFCDTFFSFFSALLLYQKLQIPPT